MFRPAAVTPPSTPSGSEPPAGEGETAGTIVSYEGGVLKIALADGSTVAGKVVEGFTEIGCGCQGHDGGQSGSSDDQGDGWSGEGDHHGGFQGDDEHGGFPQQQEGSCGISSLVAGAKVQEAELHIGPSGATWEKVELAPQQK